MSFLQKMKSLPHTVAVGSAHLGPENYPAPIYNRGPLGFLINKGEKWGGSFFWGFAKGYWREKTVVRGIPLDLLVGGALTVLSAGLTIATRGKSRLAPHLDALGDSGVMSFWNSWGAAWGTKKSGRQVFILDEGKAPPSPLPPGLHREQAVLGEIPPIQGEHSVLSDEDIMKWTAPRQ